MVHVERIKTSSRADGASRAHPRSLLEVLLSLVLAVLLFPSPVVAGSGIAWTRHNLSVSGPGPVRSSQETEICIFCHSPHVEPGNPPLWNRQTSGEVGYEPYSSSTLSSRPGQPDGVTIMCLSCHDGTIAIGAVKSENTTIQMLGAGPLGKLPSSSRSNLGTNLSGTHPVSVPYDDATRRGLAPGANTWLHSHPTDLAKRGPLDQNGKVQCTACHDPHDDPSQNGMSVPPFWRGGSFEEVCIACHVAPLAYEGHSQISKLPMGCGSCHVGHGVTNQPLLPQSEEEACFDCHGDTSRLSDTRNDGRISSQADPVRVDHLFDRPYKHPVQDTWLVHDPTEDLLSQGAKALRHIECVDCHQIHGETTLSQTGGIRDSDIVDTTLIGGVAEYELCYQCHSTNPDLPYGEWDKSEELNPSNESYHPIEAPLGKQDVPSLLSPWLPGDVMTCSDCHGSDDSDDPGGPHGSRNQWILRWSYSATDGVSESEYTYQACYKCHSRTSILSDESFQGHSMHVVEQEISCYACHDSHGSREYPGLIRFGKDFRYTSVLPSSSGRLEYDSSNGARCYLTCHGVDHDPLEYP